MMLTTVGWSLALLSCCPMSGGDDVNKTKIVSTTLTAIRETPESFKGVWVSFPIQFSEVGGIQNPFFTRFVSSDYLNFHGWADEQPIWQRDEFDDVFGLFFMKKDNSRLESVVELQRFDRVQVTGVVRNTFQGMPWIEVTGFSAIPSKVDIATLAHLFRGEQHMLNRDWVRAIAELSLAPVEGVPAHVKAAVHRDLGVCHLRLGESASALQHLETAAQLDAKRGASALETQRLIHTAQHNPAAALDREVNRERIGDSNRPLWEAFAPVTTPSAPLPGN